MFRTTKVGNSELMELHQFIKCKLMSVGMRLPIYATRRLLMVELLLSTTECIRISEVRQIEIHTASLLVHEPSLFEDEIAIA
jgi:hypothetical protein